MTLICADCGSTHIQEVELYHGYFKESQWIRQRTICVIHDDTLGYMSSCPEISKVIVACDLDLLTSIKKLGELIHAIYPFIEMKGRKIDE